MSYPSMKNIEEIDFGPPHNIYQPSREEQIIRMRAELQITQEWFERRQSMRECVCPSPRAQSVIEKHSNMKSMGFPKVFVRATDGKSTIDVNRECWGEFKGLCKSEGSSACFELRAYMEARLAGGGVVRPNLHVHVHPVYLVKKRRRTHKHVSYERVKILEKTTIIDDEINYCDPCRRNGVEKPAVAKVKTFGTDTEEYVCQDCMAYAQSRGDLHIIKLPKPKP